MPALWRGWLAYRIKGSKSEKYDGLIRAHSREEAETKAQAADRKRVYVREL
jgi:hypothetical protein